MLLGILLQMSGLKHFPSREANELVIVSLFFFFCFQAIIINLVNPGWQLLREAGRKKVVLELGGNAPCIVDETNKDRLDHVVKRLAFGAFYYSGYVIDRLT